MAYGELVAVKRLKSTGQDKESQQFLRQNNILSKLNHPNIVRYKDSFVWREKELEEDIHCLVMELLEGEPLKSLIGKNRAGLSWKQAGSILFQTLQALQYASKNGVIHRDLKPSNIFITSTGTPKLVDFGIARQDDAESTATNSVAGAKGTFDYMAPDFALQHGWFRGDEQSDIFSFGVILYHTLAGRLPFPPLGEHAARGYYMRWLGKQQPKAEFRHPVFRVLSHASTCISNCINPDRQSRFKTFDEVMAAFAKVDYRKLKHGGEIYEFTEWLGKGGFGEVFRARRMSDERNVAIKRLFSTGQSSRFVREAKILRDAAHPNLTEYVDFVEVQVRNDEREYYLILEHLEGMPGASLRDRVKNSVNGLDPGEALQLFVRYLDCLEHLHKNGIINRDIKPGNLYAPANNPQKAKIFDIGIAHDEEGTRTHGQVPCTLDFMPPEFASQTSGRGSAQSDIYSIGVSLYQSLTNELPFHRLPKAETEAWFEFFRRSENPAECQFIHPIFKTHPELVSLLRRAIAHDPNRRFVNAGVMRDEIKRILKTWGSLNFDFEDEQPTAITVAVKPDAAEEFATFRTHTLNNLDGKQFCDTDNVVPDVQINIQLGATGGDNTLYPDANSTNKASDEHKPDAFEKRFQDLSCHQPGWPSLALVECDSGPVAISSPIIIGQKPLTSRDSDCIRIYIISQSSIRIGRHRDCEIRARVLNKAGRELREESLMISQYHAQIEWDNNSYRLKDGGYYPDKGWQQSTAGLWVDGKRLSAGGEFDLVQDREYRIALGDPNSKAANCFELGARLWSAKDLPELSPTCQDIELSPETPVCLVLRRLNGPRWVYLVLGSCASLAWAYSRCGGACVGLRQGSLHLSDGQNCESLVPGRAAVAGALNFQVFGISITG